MHIQQTECRTLITVSLQGSIDRLDIGCKSPRMDCLAEPGEMLGSCPDQSTEYCLLNENTEQASFASGMYRSESI